MITPEEVGSAVGMPTYKKPKTLKNNDHHAMQYLVPFVLKNSDSGFYACFSKDGEIHVGADEDLYQSTGSNFAAALYDIVCQMLEARKE